MDNTNPLSQNPTDLVSALSALGTQLGQVSVPTPTIPALGFTMPSGTDIDAKWKEFLTRASQDPDIVKYYQNLLDQAKGDTNLAKSYIERDYQMGLRQTTENLQGTLAQEKLQSQGEQLSLTDQLNKRGIALTQGPGGKLTYGGGGESGYELGQLNQTQQLRQEAEQRSATQSVEKAGLTREKGLTSAGQQLQQTAQSLQQGQQQDILNRANTYYGMYQGKQAADLAKAQMDQQNKILSGQAGGGSTSGEITGDLQARAAGYPSYAEYVKQKGL